MSTLSGKHRRLHAKAAPKRTQGAVRAPLVLLVLVGALALGFILFQSSPSLVGINWVLAIPVA